MSLAIIETAVASEADDTLLPFVNSLGSYDPPSFFLDASRIHIGILPTACVCHGLLSLCAA